MQVDVGVSLRLGAHIQLESWVWEGDVTQIPEPGRLTGGCPRPGPRPSPLRRWGRGGAACAGARGGKAGALQPGALVPSLSGIPLGARRQNGGGVLFVKLEAGVTEA